MEVQEKNGKILCPLLGKDVWHVAKPEERVRQKFICHLVNNIEIPIPPKKKQFEIEKELLKYKNDYISTINKIENINLDSIHRLENSIYYKKRWL